MRRKMMFIVAVVALLDTFVANYNANHKRLQDVWFPRKLGYQRTWLTKTGPCQKFRWDAKCVGKLPVEFV